MLPVKKDSPACSPKGATPEAGAQTLLSPYNAWRILCRATGGSIARATFYRWLNSGRVFSVRLGFRIFVPWPALEEAIKQCRAGERL